MIRGKDIPGSHRPKAKVPEYIDINIEPGEDTTQDMKRERWEETEAAKSTYL